MTDRDGEKEMMDYQKASEDQFDYLVNLFETKVDEVDSGNQLT